MKESSCRAREAEGIQMCGGWQKGWEEQKKKGLQAECEGCFRPRTTACGLFCSEEIGGLHGFLASDISSFVLYKDDM
jgi:hypothetical protein